MAIGSATIVETLIGRALRSVICAEIRGNRNRVRAIPTRTMSWGRKSVFLMTICTMPSGERRRDIDTAIMLPFTPQPWRRHVLHLVRAAIRIVTPILPAAPPHDMLVAIHAVVQGATREATRVAILEVTHAAVTEDPGPIHDPIADIDLVFVTNRTTSTLHLLHHIVGHFCVAVKRQGV